MSTTTGNVKISQLSELGTIDNGTKLKIPVSKDLVMTIDESNLLNGCCTGIEYDYIYL